MKISNQQILRCAIRIWQDVIVRTIHSRGDVKRLKLETSHRARRLILIFHLKICREHAVLEILGKVTSFIYTLVTSQQVRVKKINAAS